MQCEGKKIRSYDWLQEKNKKKYIYNIYSPPPLVINFTPGLTMKVRPPYEIQSLNCFPRVFVTNFNFNILDSTNLIGRFGTIAPRHWLRVFIH